LLQSYFKPTESFESFWLLAPSYFHNAFSYCVPGQTVSASACAMENEQETFSQLQKWFHDHLHEQPHTQVQKNTLAA
jgi:hypothetical protein